MRLTPGALLLQFRQTFGHGVRVAWYRDRVRKQILDTVPVTGLNDNRAEVHVLTSGQDWLNLIWALKSFYAVSEHPFRLVIHEDGTVDDAAIRLLAFHFPDARIVRKAESDKAVHAALVDYPRAMEFRTTNKLSLKIMDFPLFLDSERMILLDSDVLFYSRPSVLMERICNAQYRKNSVNRDVEGALTVTAGVVKERFGFTLLEDFNSGLGLIFRDSLRYDWMEAFLELPGILDHWWRIEQTLFALCSGRFGAELLPAEYDVYLTEGLDGRPSRHYVGAVRHLMYGEGMRTLKQSGFLIRQGPP